ncbi:MAG: GTPase HflX [Acidobacteria bacterium]|nr:GTPase HflX [Acidobacteriota bacterium]
MAPLTALELPRWSRASTPNRSLEDSIGIFGNTQGLKTSYLRRLDRLSRRRLPPERLVTQELAREICGWTHETGRQLGVLVDRRGMVTHVMVGDARSLEMPDWGRIRAGHGRLRGFRCIHSHVGIEPLSRDDLTDLAILRLDAMVALTTDDNGLPSVAHIAALRPAAKGENPIERLPSKPPSQIDFDFRQWIQDREDLFARHVHGSKVTSGEGAILVSVTAGRSKAETDAQLQELRELAQSADVDVVDVLSQRRTHIDPRYLIGSGRLRDLVIDAFQSNVDLVIFDQNLTPVQARNLAERLELRVIDRTQLILDIFAQRATTRDGKLQVELAQLRYRLPRLAQRGDLSLSRLAGGIGGRGPGESKLEVDRRRVRDRINRLERELAQLRLQRESRRKQRRRRNVPTLSIVGYTNAGKSTLLRSLTRTDVLVADRLFATLDPTSRRLRVPRDREVVITDTVGFIRDLPEDLVAAFHATLEELQDADLLLHVVDATEQDIERRMEIVRRVLSGIGLADIPELLVFNQIDRLPPGIGTALARRHNGVAVSALNRIGLRNLIEQAQILLFDTPLDQGLP